MRGVPQEREALLARGGGLPFPVVDWPLWLVLAIVTIVALALHGFAGAINDTLDLRRDRALHPGRPLPSGRVRRDDAVILIVILLLVALLASAALGRASVAAASVAAGLTLLFHSAGKHVPAIGFIMLGAAHGANMLIPAPGVLMAWPIWLATVHIGITSAIAHRLARRRPRLSRRGLLTTCGFAALAAGVCAWIVYDRTGEFWPAWVRWEAAAAGGGAAILFTIFAWRLASQPVRRAARRGERIERAAALWAPIYAGAWCAGQHLWTGAIILGGLAVVALVTMTVLREVVALAESPPGWRR